MNVQPSVAEYDGTYNYDARKHILQWNIPIIDAANKSGSMEFSCNSSIPGDFFPLQVGLLHGLQCQKKKLCNALTFLAGCLRFENAICRFESQGCIYH